MLDTFSDIHKLYLPIEVAPKSIYGSFRIHDKAVIIATCDELYFVLVKCQVGALMVTD